MDASRLTLGLVELRRGLEEILILVSSSHKPDGEAKLQAHSPSSPTETVPRAGVALREPSDTPDPDTLFDHALFFITEFGQASPAVLQMWLSIDYNDAIRILKQFESQGLVSRNGRVRHKAYEVRRSRGTEFRL